MEHSADVTRRPASDLLWEVRRRFHTFTCETVFDGDSDSWMVWILRDGRRISGYRFAQRTQAERWAHDLRVDFIDPLDLTN